MIESFKIETGRLILRGWRDDDVAPFHAMGNDPEVMRYLGPPMTVADAEGARDRMNALLADRGYCFWAVERKADRVHRLLRDQAGAARHADSR